MTPTLSHDDAAQRRLEIAAYVQEGATRVQACKRFGVSDRLVRMACEEHDVDYDRKPGGNYGAVIAIVGALKRARKGTTLQKIADNLGTSRQRVHQILGEAVNEGLVAKGKFGGGA